MWGQYHPLFAFPSSVEAHNAMTIRAAGQQLHMSRLLPYQANINFTHLSLQYQIQDSYIFVTSSTRVYLQAMALIYSRFLQKARELAVLWKFVAKKKKFQAEKTQKFHLEIY
jgi:hypothetical protein